MRCILISTLASSVLALSAFLGGCTSVPRWVEASPEEVEACEAAQCSVWTPEELGVILRYNWLRGYQAGKNSL